MGVVSLKGIEVGYQKRVGVHSTESWILPRYIDFTFSTAELQNFFRREVVRTVFGSKVLIGLPEKPKIGVDVG